jgi:hypothetical protein
MSLGLKLMELFLDPDLLGLVTDSLVVEIFPKPAVDAMFRLPAMVVIRWRSAETWGEC